MANARPYFTWRIDQLESLHRANPKDLEQGQLILEELKHRATDRAAALQVRIEEALAGHRQTSVRASPIDYADTVPLYPTSIAATAPSSSPSPASPTSVATFRPFTDKHNDPAAILAGWAALEALTPQTYRRPADLANDDQRRVAPLDGSLPWFRNERSRPNYQLYYQLILGAIPVDRATSELVRVFGRDEERSDREREKAAIAAILVDRNGKLLEDNAVSISSFAWALPIALSGDLVRLGNWINVERELTEGLTSKLSCRDQEGNLLPIDADTVKATFEWLIAALGLPNGLFEAPSFALRVYHHIKAKGTPEVALLNSFFLSDISRAAKLIGSGRPGKALARYVGLEKVEHSANLLKDLGVVEALVAPSKMPAARWPAPGGHPLVTLQQAAVNAARSELGKDGAGIVAVNGPPGTGKTTLLRDLVAACVLDRASAMAAFDDPLTAFSTTGQKLSAGGNAFLHLYRLDDALKGHEVLVASSNNKAVENVSKELPAAKALGSELRYFKVVSDRLLCKKEDSGSLIPGEPTWGLIAAVLGNAANRSAFQDAMWWDNDRSLRLYLKAAKGDSVVREIKDEAGRVLKREIPTVVKEEAPPTPENAKIQWNKTRAAFKAIKEEVDSELRKLESMRHTCQQLPRARDTLTEAIRAHDAAKAKLAESKNDLSIAEAAMAIAQTKADDAERTERRAFAERPSWIWRLFRTKTFKQWQAAHEPLAEASRECAQGLSKAAAKRALAQACVASATTDLTHAEQRLADGRSALSVLEAMIGEYRRALGDRIVDEHFFDGGHEGWNLASPWIPDAVHAKREALFSASLELHRAFIDVSAQKISHNIGALMGAMQAGAFKDEGKRALLSDLWSTLYLVVPVLSTTFASVDRMLGDVPPSSIGWLLIDEAGQASPQAAVGAIMRARRVIVVGDPLQIPPVVTLPQRLAEEVAKYFNIDHEHWFAPDASTQTVADDASRFQAEFRADVGVRQVGIPLLVHRRCQEPMFGISNRIAYDEQMVYAANPSVPPIVQALGPSAWLDVDGHAESKWCPAEGEAVVELLKTIAAADVVQPDVYLITPFRIVSYELRRRLEFETDLFRRLGVSDLAGWIKDRVGTIHTFQGKEAEVVIAVLGAPMSAQNGARRWASSKPNILNVMVSRAKSGLYIIGSRAAWSTVGHTREVAARLPSYGRVSLVNATQDDPVRDR